MRVSVVALGKIGLPLAVQFAAKGHQVVGVDINPKTVEQVNAGQEPFPGEAHLAELLAETVADGRLRATTDYADAVPGSDAVVLVVPLFVDETTGEPEFGWMESATRSLAEHLSPGTLVSYETTLPVGTTRNRWKPLLEEGSGLTEGQDFHLVFSPERVLTGRVFADLRKYPKLVGGLSEEGAKRAIAFYEAVLDFDERPDLERGNGVWDLGSAEAAELAKLAETTYRDVNIGLANQFARFAGQNGIDVHQVIEASNSQPYSHIHRPGIAVGGHCIPVYPRLYLWTDPEATVVRAAREANLRHAGVHRRPARGRVRRPDRRQGGRARRGVPWWRQGDRVLRGLPGRGGARRPAAPRCPCTTRCTPTRSCQQLGFTPYALGDAGGRRGAAGGPRGVRAADPGRPAGRARCSSTAVTAPTRLAGRACAGS